MELGAWILDKQGYPLLLTSEVIEYEDRYIMWFSRRGHERLDYDRLREIHIAPLHKNSDNMIDHLYLHREVIAKFYTRFLMAEKSIVDDDEPYRFILYKNKAISKNAVLVEFWPATCREQIWVATDQFQIDLVTPYHDEAYCINREKFPLYMRSSPVAYLTFRWAPDKAIALYDFRIFPRMEKTYLEYRRNREDESCGI